MQFNAVAPIYPRSNSNQTALLNAPKRAKVTTQLEQEEAASESAVLPKCKEGSTPSISQPKSLLQRSLEVGHPQICAVWGHKLKTTFLVEEASLEASSLQGKEKMQFTAPGVEDFIIFELPKQQTEFSFGCACEAVSKLSVQEKEAYFIAFLDHFQEAYIPRAETDKEQAKNTLQDQIGILAKAILSLGINTNQAVEELNEEAQFKVLCQVVEPFFGKCLEELKKNKAKDPMILEVYETLVSYLGNLLCSKPAGTTLIESPELALFATKLARALKEAENIKQAKKVLERALSIKERHYGKKHPEVGFTLVDLAATIQALGDTQIAKKLIKRAVSIQKRHYGREHPIYATTLVNMVDILGRQCKAKKLLERARPILVGQYDSNPVEVARVLIGLARFGKVNMKQAKVLLEDGLSILRNDCREDNLWMEFTLDNVIITITASDNLRKRREIWECVLVIEERHYGTDHVEVAVALHNLANIIRKSGDAEDAKALYERVLIIKERHYGPDHIEVALTLHDLADIIRELGDAKEAKALYGRTLRIEERYYGTDHIGIATTLRKLGTVIRELGDAKETRVLYGRALSIQERHYGTDSMEVVTTVVELSAVIRELGDTKEANRLLERALSIKERYYGTNNIHLASTLFTLAQFIKENDVERAKGLLERALIIQKRHYGLDHPKVAATLASIVKIDELESGK